MTKAADKTAFADNHAVGLSARDWLKIQSAFRQFPQVKKVWLYGSRAKGTFKKYSDIDLTLEGDALSLEVLNDLSIALDDLLLPYDFDVSILSQIKNDDLRSHIKRVGKLIYEA